MRTLALTLIIATLIVGPDRGYAQIIENSGFESWENVSFFDEPDYYVTTNVYSYLFNGEANVHKTGESHSGDYAMRLETVDSEEGPLFGAAFIGNPDESLIWGGVPFASRPDSLHGYVKYDIMSGDTAYIILYFKKSGVAIGFTYKTFFSSQSGYVKFSTPIQWLVPAVDPDTLTAAITSSVLNGLPAVGSTLFVDDLSFSGTGEPFPNGEFESWNNFASEEPQNWFTSNLFTVFVGNTGVTKSTDSYEGTYAARLESVTSAWDDTLCFMTNGYFTGDGMGGGMSVSQTPDKLTGYYKYSPVGPDTAFAAVTLFHYDPAGDSSVMLEEVFLPLTATQDYTFFELAVPWDTLPVPDTVNIAFASGNFIEDSTYFGLGSLLLVDALNITYKPPVGLYTRALDDQPLLTPNPASGSVRLNFREDYTRPVRIVIMDISGKERFSRSILPLKDHGADILLPMLERGMYIYSIECGDRNHRGKLIME